MDEKSTTDLSFVTSEEMFQELKKRFAGIVIATEAYPDDKKTATWIDWHGGLSLCLGLAHRTATRLTRIATEDRPDDEGE